MISDRSKSDASDPAEDDNEETGEVANGDSYTPNGAKLSAQASTPDRVSLSNPVHQQSDSLEAKVISDRSNSAAHDPECEDEEVDSEVETDENQNVRKGPVGSVSYQPFRIRSRNKIAVKPFQTTANNLNNNNNNSDPDRASLSKSSSGSYYYTTTTVSATNPIRSILKPRVSCPNSSPSGNASISNQRRTSASYSSRSSLSNSHPHNIPVLSFPKLDDSRASQDQAEGEPQVHYSPMSQSSGSDSCSNSSSEVPPGSARTGAAERARPATPPSPTALIEIVGNRRRRFFVK